MSKTPNNDEPKREMAHVCMILEFDLKLSQNCIQCLKHETLVFKLFRDFLNLMQNLIQNWCKIQ